MSFSKIKQLSPAQAILLALLVVHSVWIMIHLGLVAQGQINPWKMGGYGMYTRPQAVPEYKIELTDGSAPEDRQLFKDIDFSSLFEKTMRTTFHCEPLNPDAVSQFFADNQKLIGHELTMTAATTDFLREPIRLERRVLGSADITWDGAASYQVKGQFCDDPFAFSGIAGA